MAEVPFRPVRQLSEYKGKGASASREPSCVYALKVFSLVSNLIFRLNLLKLNFLLSFSASFSIFFLEQF